MGSVLWKNIFWCAKQSIQHVRLNKQLREKQIPIKFKMQKSWINLVKSISPPKSPHASKHLINAMFQHSVAKTLAIRCRGAFFPVVLRHAQCPSGLQTAAGPNRWIPPETFWFDRGLFEKWLLDFHPTCARRKESTWNGDAPSNDLTVQQKSHNA